MNKKIKLKELCIEDEWGKYGIPASAEKFDINKTRYLRITDISEDGELLNNDVKSVSAPDIDKYILKEGDIVFARTGNSTGKSYYHESKNGDLAFAGFLIKYSLDKTKINPKYLKFFTITNEYKTWVKNLSVGSTRGNINAQTFGDCPISVPERKQQDLLVSSLSLIIDKIELNNRINAELEAMAKTLYDYWFVQFDFPDKNGKPYKSNGGKMVWNEELKREIPEGWEVNEIEAFAQFVNGKGIKKEDVNDSGNYAVYGSNGITGFTNKILFKEPVIAIGRVGANYGEVHYSIAPCWISDNAVTAQPYKTFYLWWLIDTLKRINYLKIAGGSAQPLITQGQLKKLKFAVPKDTLFKDFDEIVNPIYMQLNLNIKQNQKLTELRDWLLPMLMNGQVKVSEL
jgi:type I restriction enzyme S subunit